MWRVCGVCLFTLSQRACHHFSMACCAALACCLQTIVPDFVVENNFIPTAATVSIWGHKVSVNGFFEKKDSKSSGVKAAGGQAEAWLKSQAAQKKQAEVTISADLTEASKKRRRKVAPADALASHAAQLPQPAQQS